MYGVCAASCDFALAAEVVKPPGGAPIVTSSSAPADLVKATVVTDGAAVYTGPDFDSPVQDYLGFQTGVTAVKRPVPGRGGMGLFYKIQYGNKIGFIPDTDIKAGGRKDAENGEKKKKKPKNPDDEEHKRPGKEPIYLTRYLGGALSRVNYSEKFEGHRFSDEMLMYGLRMTGPGTLFDGPPLDMNVWFSVQKPGIYKPFTNYSPSGFLIFGDLAAMFPLYDEGNNVVNFSLGMMWAYTHYNVPVKGLVNHEIINFDSQEFKIGVDVSAGYGHRFGRYLLRADVKYYIEKVAYPGYMASFQMEY